MNLAIVALTVKGRETAKKLKIAFPGAVLFLTPRVADGSEDEKFTELFNVLIGRLFEAYTHLICICATGIVVRAISPYIVHKSVDPAVVVVDDGGKFAIPLIGGHLAGANKLAQESAEILGGQAVITTASDNLNIIVAEMWGKEYGMLAENFPDLPAVNGAIVNNEPIAVISDWEIPLHARTLGYPDKTSYYTFESYREQSEELTHSAYVYVTDKVVHNPLKPYLILRPKTLVAGIGVRRGFGFDVINTVVNEAFEKAGLALKSLSCIASIDAKSDEEGLLTLARNMGLPTRFFTKEELQKIITAKELKTSAFVEKQMGVGAVCEPAAIAVAKDSTLIMNKHQAQGVTVAVARVPFIL